jgi:hypothetical protein
MGVNYNIQKIITDGIVLFLDSENPKSYPGSGNIWYDLSGNNRNFSGNSSYISSLDGIRSGATWSCPSSLVGDILNTDYHSIFFNIKFNSTETYSEAWSGSWNKLFEHTGSSGDRSPGIWRYPSNRTIHWRYNPNNTGADFGPTSSSGNFSLNTWFTVGVTKNGSLAKSYVNGVNVASSTVSFPKQTGSSNINLFPGYPVDIANMNQVIIFDRALSDEEVLHNFNSLRGRYGI